MNTKEKTKELIRRAYENAKKHGFHNQEWSKEHLLMLILTEVGEMVEADRKNKHADVVNFEKWRDVHNFNYFDSDFECFIKDSVEDEMADVAIRIFDMCGALGLDVEICYDMESEYKTMCEGKSLCEKAFILTNILCQSTLLGYEYEEELDETIGAALSFLFALAQDMLIDLMMHIELKMKYNEGRTAMHNKKY